MVRGPMINIILFSKDRACQLDLCLRSLKHYFAEYEQAKISVLYTYSNDDAKKAYELLMQENESITFLIDKTFKETLLATVDKTNPFTMFLVDDIVFKLPFSMNDKELGFMKDNDLVIAHSLRLWKGINHCYATNQPSRVPSFVKGNVWNWTVAEGDWGYPMSVDGNIYKTDFIYECIAKINFANPNQLEASLSHSVNRNKTYMTCYPLGSKLLNIPANIVQKTFNNRHGNIVSIEHLNKNFLSGNRIDFSWFAGYENNSVHVELEYKWCNIC